MKSTRSKAVWYTSVAAGVATASSVQGAIMYTDVAPDLTANTISWDLDNGGVTDFRLEVTTDTKEKSNLVPSGDAAGVAITGLNNVDSLESGETIGSATAFSDAGETKTLFDEGNTANSDWSVGEHAYLGLRIQLAGELHYGWAEVSINQVGDSFNHTLYGYAFENTPGAEIIAGAVPEPSTVALLVAGAAGAASIRRRRDSLS